MNTSSSTTAFSPIARNRCCSYPWRHVTSANWQKYPSELTPHVLNVDYLHRAVDAATGQLHTERLLTCSQSAPAFLLRMINDDPMAYVWERSVVDGTKQQMRLQAQNLTYAHLITVQEECTYHSSISNAKATIFEQVVQITSLWGSNRWGAIIQEKMEDFCASGFQANASKGRVALEEAIKRLFSHHYTHDDSSASIATDPPVVNK